MIRGYAIAVAAVLLLPPAGRAQSPDRRAVTLVVRDTAGNALPYVNAQLGSTLYITSDSGRFTVSAARQALKLTLRRIGYEPTDVRIPEGSDTTFTVAMTPVPVRLSAVQVLGVQISNKLSLRGFYDRMRDVERGINRGYFITPEELEQRKPNFVTQMLEAYPSIRVVRPMEGEHYAEIVGVGRCKMTVYLDGTRVIGKVNRRAEEPINVLVKPSEIAGVEVYPRGVGAPPQYQELNGSCGIVLIWTR